MAASARTMHHLQFTIHPSRIAASPCLSQATAIKPKLNCEPVILSSTESSTVCPHDPHCLLHRRAETVAPKPCAAEPRGLSLPLFHSSKPHTWPVQSSIPMAASIALCTQSDLSIYRAKLAHQLTCSPKRTCARPKPPASSRVSGQSSLYW
ncbi:hypothetical protein M0R45_036140 [Rubus argutus]|uniref:Uncharacterized protein n=1 Tax=Rubus argutus TaxID=59490 RepID=A0AAW1VXR1_RUBAR